MPLNGARFAINHKQRKKQRKARLTINGQTILTTGTDGTVTIYDDCTGTGMFYIPEFRQQITYVSVLTDEDGQIQLLNTDSGIVLQGHGKRIAPAERVP